MPPRFGKITEPNQRCDKIDSTIRYRAEPKQMCGEKKLNPIGPMPPRCGQVMEPNRRCDET